MFIALLRDCCPIASTLPALTRHGRRARNNPTADIGRLAFALISTGDRLLADRYSRHSRQREHRCVVPVVFLALYRPVCPAERLKLPSWSFTDEPNLNGLLNALPPTRRLKHFDDAAARPRSGCTTAQLKIPLAPLKHGETTVG